MSELSGNPEQVPYTPTTEEVRNGYVGAGSEPNPYVSEDERAEFDRWLSEIREDAFAQGRDSQRDSDTAKERERIIKLLEGLDTELWCGTNLQIVALIKGEEQ